MAEATIDTPEERKRPTAMYAALAGLLLFAVAAIAGIVIVYSVLSSQISDLDERANNAEAALATAEEKVDENARAIREAGNAQIEEFKAQTETSLAEIENTLKTVNTKVTRVQECLPELQTYIDGMSISTFDTGGYLTGAYLSYGQQVSRRCLTMFRPRAPGE